AASEAPVSGSCCVSAGAAPASQSATPNAIARMPRRRAAFSPAARVALLHAVAHIELNAIDLAWDLLARFGAGMPRDFLGDWIAVAAQEAEHFALVAKRLPAFGAAYGDLPAHDGLWEAAEATASDLLARLAVVPLVLEARGLDVTPGMIERLERFGDRDSAAALALILAEEVGHVAAGARWFRFECAAHGLDPVPTYRALVARHFKGRLKPPFNHAARAAAGFGREFYDHDAG
ncbi:MAG: ferritin-like domain-containing protein, partial [Stellaceae bacterium]